MDVQGKIDEWLATSIRTETGARRKERLERGLEHATTEFLKRVWYPAVGNLEHLHAEWEVRDFGGGYRYLDLAYMPGGAKGGIELQGYGPHARELDIRRFKDLCMRHSLLALDGWTFLPIAYPSIIEEPQVCLQLVLAFIGRFASMGVSPELDWLEAETVRYARRVLRPLTPEELRLHLRVSVRHAYRILRGLVNKGVLLVSTGTARYRTYQLAQGALKVQAKR